MRIEIRNLAKINNADIEINGITVIVGNNNTGKSTVGKALFSIFNSVYDINTKVYKTREKEILRRYRAEIRKLFLNNAELFGGEMQSYSHVKNSEIVFRRLIQRIRSEKYNINDIDCIVDTINNEINKYGIVLEDEEIDNLIFTLKKESDIVSQISDYDISLEIIERFFKDIFSEQICSLKNNNVSEVNIYIHEMEQKFRFVDNKCSEWESSFEIMHEAFLIDNPFILDELNAYMDSYGDNDARTMLLRKIEESGMKSDDSIISAVLAKEKIKDIQQIINNIVPENIINKNGEWVAAEDSLKEEIHVDNLSAGVKSFLVLKILLERGILKEKDVLILDEPEIHLHPEWQIKYAELIVLMQKMFDLSILVTTHSRDFFEAINIYSKKYSIVDKCHYYLSNEIEGEVGFRNVSNNVDEIYNQLVAPSRLLDKIKFELEEDE